MVPLHPPLIASLTALMTLGAIVIARESRLRHPARPYLFAGGWLLLHAFALLYFGALRWQPLLLALSGGAIWAIGIGIAFRRHSSAQPGLPAFARVLCMLLIALSVLSGWHEHAVTKAHYRLPVHSKTLPFTSWWNAQPPATKLAGMTRSEGELQYAGDLLRLRRVLAASGWRELPKAHWIDPLQSLNSDLRDAQLPILPQARDGYAEVARWEKAGAVGGRQLLLIWPSRWQLSDTAFPVYRLQILPHRLWQVRNWLRIWLPENADRRQMQAELAQWVALEPQLQSNSLVDSWRLRALDTPR